MEAFIKISWVLRNHSSYELSQWEEALICNAFSHWSSSYPEWSLGSHRSFCRTPSWHNSPRPLVRRPGIVAVRRTCGDLGWGLQEDRPRRSPDPSYGAPWRRSAQRNLQYDERISNDDVIKWKHFPRYWPCVWVTGPGMGVTKPISSVLLFFCFFRIIKTQVTCTISRSYLTGVTAAELRRHLTIMNVI